MYESIDSSPDADVLESEYVRLLGYPVGRRLEGRARELADQTREWYRENGRPWVYIRELESCAVENDELRLDGRRFHSDYLLRQFRAARADGAFALAVSAGPECEERAQELWKASKPDEYFFMEVFGGAVVERLITRVGGALCSWAEENGRFALPHYSPGYPEWDVSQQVPLLKLIAEGSSKPFPRALEVFDSGMLRPKKSLLGVIGVTSDRQRALNLSTLSPCERCSLAGCAYRRKPYIYQQRLEDAMSQEDIEGPLAGRGTDETSANGAMLNPEIRYATSPRALRKWASERLDLNRSLNGQIEARFRYEGTTCSNMGHPIHFIYTIKLDGPENQYRILEANCMPTPEDEGHALMCQYLSRKEAFLNEITDERPLVGEPLEKVAAWDAPTSYSGCYCDQEARDHKWRIAYEVLHYALSRTSDSTSTLS